MPQSHEQQSATAHERPPAAQHEATHADDRSPGAARAASLAGLRREAAAVAPQATSAQQQKQHGKADQSSHAALETSMTLAATQLRNASDEIDHVLASPTTLAGIEPQLQMIRARITAMSQIAFDLNAQIGSMGAYLDGSHDGGTAVYRYLVPRLGALDSAFASFEESVHRAEDYAQAHGQPLGASTQNMRDKFTFIHNKFQLDAKAITQRRIDSRPEAAVFEQALGENVTAAIEATHAVRIGSAERKEVIDQLSSAIRHVGAVASLLTQLTDGKTMKRFKPRVQQMLHELQLLDAHVSRDPELEQWAHNGQLPGYLNTIHLKLGR